MDVAARARIARELPRGAWAAENHGKLVSFLAEHSGTGALALFDADNTTWTGDLGDGVLIHLARSLGLSARLDDVLPRVLEVPAEGFGVAAPGRLFAAARASQAREAMTSAFARVTGRRALEGFSPELVLPGGPLHGEPVFMNAHRVYAGTILATYNLLEASVGCLAFDESDARDATELFPEDARAFFGGRVRFPAILDTGPRQAALRADGRLGSYSQIAIWEALDKTPDELRAIGLEVFGRPDAEAPFHAIFPVDIAGATTPAPLDFAIDPARFAPRGRPAESVLLGSTSMLEGTRARPEIVDLFAAMAREGIVPAVVTASQVDLVRAVLDRHYGFAGFPVVGMTPALAGGRYAEDLAAPAPYRAGKVDAARAVAKLALGSEDARPALCAGDTTTDLEMLAYAGGYRLFFDRGKRPLMDLAEHLLAAGHGARTLVQLPL